MEKSEKELVNSSRINKKPASSQHLKKESLNEQPNVKQEHPMLIELLKDRNIKIPPSSQEKITKKNSDISERPLSTMDRNTHFSEQSERSEKSLQSIDRQDKIIHYSDKSIRDSMKSEKSIQYENKYTQCSDNSAKRNQREYFLLRGFFFSQYKSTFSSKFKKRKRRKI